MSIPRGIITSLEFGILSPNEIISMSTVEIIKSDRFIGRRAVDGGLYDAKLGTISKLYKCATCGLDADHCPSHWGYIRLARPIINFAFLKKIKELLQLVCYSCSRILIPVEKWPILYAISNKAARRNQLKKMIKSKNIACPFCGNIQPTYSCEIKGENYRKQREHIYYRFFDPETKKLSDVSYIREPQEIITIFSAITNEEVELLGYSSFSRPEWMLISVLPIPPVAVRSPIMSNDEEKMIDDFDRALIEIIDTNNEILQSKNDLAIKKKCAYLYALVGQYISGKMKTAKIFNRGGDKKKIKSVEQRLVGKIGLIRQNLIAKRVNYSGRTVITGDPTIHVDEVGIPTKFAMSLTIPERVTIDNIDFLTSLVRNGPDIYPGANMVIQSGKQFNTKLKVVREKPLAIGDIVQRHMVNGDVIMFNRQPTLRRMSFMCHRVLVLPGNTFRLNPCICLPYNADFDGDEMNEHVPISLQTRAEVFELAHVPIHTRNPQSASAVWGANQDTLLGSFKLTAPDVIVDKYHLMNYLSHIDNFSEIIPQTPLQPKGLASLGGALMQYFRGIDAYSTTLPKSFSLRTNRVEIENGRIVRGQVDDSLIGSDKGVGGLTDIIPKDISPNEVITFFYNMQHLVDEWVKQNSHTIGISDFVVPNKDFKKNAIDIMERDGYGKYYELLKQIDQKTFVPSTGRSVAYSERVIVNHNGKIFYDEIGKIIDKEFMTIDEINDNGSSIIKNIDPTIDSLMIQTIAHDGAVSWQKINQICRHPPDSPLILVRTQSGRRVIATTSHSFLTIDGKEIIPVDGSKLCLGMCLPVILQNKIIDEVPNCTGAPINSGPSGPLKLSADCEIDSHELTYGYICGVFLSTAGKFSRSNGGESEIRFYHSNEDFIKSLNKLINSINIPSRMFVNSISSTTGEDSDTQKEYFIIAHEDSSADIDSSFTKLYNLLKNFVYGGPGDNSVSSIKKYINSNIWTAIYTSKNPLIIDFIKGIIRGFFDVSIQPFTSAGNLSVVLEQISTLLSVLGIFCIFNKDQRGIPYLKIPTEHQNLFFDQIGSNCSQISTVMKLVKNRVKYAGPNRVSETYYPFVWKDMIPNEKGIMTDRAPGSPAPSPGTPGTPFSQIIFDPIVNISYILPKDTERENITFDFGVPGNNTFMLASGVFVHNSIHDHFEIMAYMILNGAFETVQGTLKQVSNKQNNMMTHIQSGSKGKQDLVIRALLFLGQQAISGHRAPMNYNERTLPCYKKYDNSPEARGFIKNSYYNGLAPQEFMFHMVTGREGVLDAKMKTADSGYINRKLNKLMENFKIDYDSIVKDSNGQIVQYVYGGMGFDAAMVEIISSFDFVTYSNDQMKTKYIIDEKNSFPREDVEMNNTIWFGKLMDYHNMLQEYYVGHRNIMQSDLYVNPSSKIDEREYNIKFYSPFNLDRIIYNMKPVFPNNEHGGDGLSPLTIPEIVQKVNELCDKIYRGHNNYTKNNIIPEIYKYATLALQAYICAYLSPKRVINEFKLSRTAFDCAINSCFYYFQKALVQPGEAVGNVAAQSVCESITQGTLKSYHVVGVASTTKVTGKVPRLKEIIDRTTVQKQKAPTMTIFMVHKDNQLISMNEYRKLNDDEKREYDAHQLAFAREVGNKITYTYLRQLMSNITIIYEKEPLKEVWYKNDKRWIDNFYDVSLTETRPNPGSLSEWCIRIELNPKKVVATQVRMYMIKNQFSHYFNNTYVLHSDDNDDSLVIRVYLLRSMLLPNITELKQIDDLRTRLIDKFMIRGVQGIEAVFINSNGVIFPTINHGTGKIEARKEFILETAGTNLPEILILPEVDPIHTISDNPVEIFETLGIEAARAAIIHEISTQISDNTAHHQILMIADTMTFLGTIVPLNRFGINNPNYSPIHRITFEQVPDRIRDAAICGDIDHVRGVTANLMTGQYGYTGTGSQIEILLDEKKLFNNLIPGNTVGLTASELDKNIKDIFLTGIEGM